MEFKDILKKYMDDLSIRPKKLAHESGVSAVMIEEFLKGTKVPKAGSTQVESLIAAIERIADEKGDADIAHSDILYDFMTAIRETARQPEPISAKITSVLRSLHVSPRDLSKGVGCTTVFLSQLRSGAAMPDDPEDFADKLADYLTENYTDEAGAAKLSNVIGISADALRYAERARVEIRDWFLDGLRDEGAAVTADAAAKSADGGDVAADKKEDGAVSTGALDTIRSGLHNISPEVIECGRLILSAMNSRSDEDSMIELYQNMGREELETVLSHGFRYSGRQLTIRNTLPIASMPEEMLTRIMDRCEVKGIQRIKTMEFYEYMRGHAADRLALVPHFDVVPRLSREVFEATPLALDLDEDEISKRLYYTYEEYEEHLGHYEKYVSENPNLTVVYADHLDYPELSVRVRCGECVIITRSGQPKMNLVISEPHICEMFEEYISLQLLGKDDK